MNLTRLRLIVAPVGRPNARVKRLTVLTELRERPMNPVPIELCTTAELVGELMSRNTFLGVVIHSEKELKGEWPGEGTFQVHFNSNLDTGQASRLLDAVAQYMSLHYNTGDQSLT
jgi:hypothetical protein